MRVAILFFSFYRFLSFGQSDELRNATSDNTPGISVILKGDAKATVFRFQSITQYGGGYEWRFSDHFTYGGGFSAIVRGPFESKEYLMRGSSINQQFRYYPGKSGFYVGFLGGFDYLNITDEIRVIVQGSAGGWGWSSYQKSATEITQFLHAFVLTGYQIQPKFTRFSADFYASFGYSHASVSILTGSKELANYSYTSDYAFNNSGKSNLMSVSAGVNLGFRIGK
jgi:hypothetical protein